VTAIKRHANQVSAESQTDPLPAIELAAQPDRGRRRRGVLRYLKRPFLYRSTMATGVPSCPLAMSFSSMLHFVICRMNLSPAIQIWERKR